MGENDERGAASVLVLRKVRQILECFTIERAELTLQQITKATGLPASTCQRLVTSLVREGFLDRHGDVYRIGLALVRWAAPGTLGLDIVQLTRPAIQWLRDRTGESACLYVRDGPFRTVVSLAETRAAVMRIATVGMVMPLHAGSAGKVFMAFDPEARRAAVGHGLVRHTARTVVDIDVLDEQLAEVRRNGYSATFEERDAGAASISAPVFGSSGELVAVLGMLAPTQRLTPADVGEIAPQVVAAAEDASRRLGHRPAAG
ncbi:DNA-binding transcriptional regulator, IclR family [Nonomuraea maritima]|uniref:DNA-binding transcriptional regulator, IclR family n=1 Tax=Nonomuraea maritima TaxID=683260 RepID=A0A1G8SQI0_9ACTN|nr:IclR family transcriptional regulator [Nonomuraea maritima]SDJ31403.1 DNA-binding transcriptional regulator, IclR family [Nonomuraea maritima]